MEQRVMGRLRKDFHVGSEDWIDVLFRGQRIRWMKDPQSGPYYWSQSRKGELKKWRRSQSKKNTKEKLHCTPTVYTRYRSLLRQINWLQSRTQIQCCYKFSRCASKAASRTIGDVRAFNKLARQLKSQPVKLQFLATHKTVENNWISRCPLQKQWRWVFTEMHGIKKNRIATAFLEGWNVIWKSCWLRKSND